MGGVDDHAAHIGCVEHGRRLGGRGARVDRYPGGADPFRGQVRLDGRG